MMADTDEAYAVTHASQWLLSPASQPEDLTLLLDYLRQAYSPPAYVPAEHNMIMSAVKTVAGALAYCGGHIIAVESIGSHVRTWSCISNRKWEYLWHR